MNIFPFIITIVIFVVLSMTACNENTVQERGSASRLSYYGGGANNADDEGSASTSDLVRLKEACHNLGDSWSFDSTKSECTTKGSKKNADEACKTWGSGFYFDTTKNSCANSTTVVPLSEACAKLGMFWLAHPEDGTCILAVQTLNTQGLCSAVGSSWLYSESRQSCTTNPKYLISKSNPNNAAGHSGSAGASGHKGSSGGTTDEGLGSDGSGGKSIAGLTDSSSNASHGTTGGANFSTQKPLETLKKSDLTKLENQSSNIKDSSKIKVTLKDQTLSTNSVKTSAFLSSDTSFDLKCTDNSMINGIKAIQGNVEGNKAIIWMAILCDDGDNNDSSSKEISTSDSNSGTASTFGCDSSGKLSVGFAVSSQTYLVNFTPECSTLGGSATIVDGQIVDPNKGKYDAPALLDHALFTGSGSSSFTLSCNEDGNKNRVITGLLLKGRFSGGSQIFTSIQLYCSTGESS